MKTADTTFLIDLMNGLEGTKRILESGELIFTTQVNMFEIIRGFFLNDNPTKALARAFDFLESVRVLPLDDNGIARSAEISADLKKKGTEISDVDCMTAGISLSKGINTIITRNVKHFKRIGSINVETY